MTEQEIEELFARLTKGWWIINQTLPVRLTGDSKESSHV